MKAEVQKNVVIQEVNVSNCRFCGSNNLKKDGVRKNKTGIFRSSIVETVTTTSLFNIGFEKMKHNPQAITSAMQLYFSGESLRNTHEISEALRR